MRITIEIDENILKEIQKATAIPKKSPAVQKALEMYLRAIRKRKFLDKVLSGQTDYNLTNDELEEMSRYDLTPPVKNR